MWKWCGLVHGKTSKCGLSLVVVLEFKIHYISQCKYQTKNELNWIMILKFYFKFSKKFIMKLLIKVIIHDIEKIIIVPIYLFNNLY
jgi:hypothetical protein